MLYFEGKQKANLMFPLPFETEKQITTRREGGLQPLLNKFESLTRLPDSPIRAIHHQPASPGEFRDFPEALRPELREMLGKRGIRQLYAHQAEALDQVFAGNDLVIVTPTASGKTLCYNLPVVNRILEAPDARALYLFPTKALAEDQLSELQTALDEIGSPVKAFTFDGDTPSDARRAIRQRANIVLTNPDMLHTGILPHHTKWTRLFENLQFIVIDELHSYRGVYGSHLANVLRRLRRICEFYGSKPQFVCCSATIANPRELAEALTARTFAMVDRSGAPRGDRYFAFYNPPVVNRELGIRRSYINETRRMALECLDQNLHTLIFANSRLATEVLLTYLKDACDNGRAPTGSVRGYRGGYLPRERREIEQKMRAGEIRAIVATSALELGIDLGSLDAVVMAGYPGTVASTWQRAGRAGRRQTPSMAILVASSAPLDQYIVEHPEYFFGGSPEHAYISPDNLEILLSHLKCAAFELPLAAGEAFGGPDTTALCEFLAGAGFLHQSAGCWHWTSDSYPADAVSLRAITSDNFVVVDITGEPKVIAEVSFPTALTTLHEKAIYLHEARQYHVDRFDYKERKAYVRRVDCDYYTDAIDYTQVHELQRFEESPLGAAHKLHGEVRVNTQVVGFKKIRFYTLENVGAGKLSIPEQEMHSTAFWLHLPAAILGADVSSEDRQSGLAAAGHALHTVAAVLLMCDPRDLGVAVGEEALPGVAWEPNLFLYDKYPGGIGQSAPLFRMAERLVREGAALIEACPCEAGCPSCVGPPLEVGKQGKAMGLAVLRALA